PPRATLLPYTTLFRSSGASPEDTSAGGSRGSTMATTRPMAQAGAVATEARPRAPAVAAAPAGRTVPATPVLRGRLLGDGAAGLRSEEHTSELQSRENL